MESSATKEEEEVEDAFGLDNLGPLPPRPRSSTYPPPARSIKSINATNNEPLGAWSSFGYDESESPTKYWKSMRGQTKAEPSEGELRRLSTLAHVSGELTGMLKKVRRSGTSLRERLRVSALRTLSTVPPFSYLPETERRDLVQDLHIVEFSDGEVIVQQGGDDRDVYITTTGRVTLMMQKSQPSLGESATSYLGYLDAPTCFGEWETLFDTTRHAQIIAGGDVTAYRMDGERFERLLSHQAFRLKLGLGLRKKGLFDDIENFVAIVVREVALEKQIDFDGILASYRRMVPAIHAKLHSQTLDIEGWTYAVRRLPETVTSTYVFLLSNSIPMPFMHENFDLTEIYVRTVARRRRSFAVDQGKLLVLMREKFSDVLDFISLLCAHVHESTKLRLKLNNPAALDALHNCLWSSKRRLDFPPGGGAMGQSSDNQLRFHRHALYATAPVEEQADALAKLPLEEEEIDGLKTIWPADFLYRVWDMVVLHENIQVLGDFSQSYEEFTDRWAERIRSAAIELLRKRDGKVVCVSTDLVTHIVSSNTTSVRNLLSPYIQKHKKFVHQWGVEAHPEIENDTVLSESDKLYALCTAYMRTHPEATKDCDEFDSSCIVTLRQTELTGIQVELVDLDALENAYDQHGIEPDPYLAPYFNNRNDKRRRLLVNIDYAFGKQAEHLISALSLLFGESLSSVGVMGKAGGLQGKRGDVIVADYLVHQIDDEVTLIDNEGVDRDALAHLSKRTVWSGGVITVLGTLLQDRRLLQYFKKLYGCVSLEMEGSFYARELMRFKKAGLLSRNLNLRFLYYVSDTPLSQDQTETLSKDLGLSEVIPPQYAVTRELLRLVLIEN